MTILLLCGALWMSPERLSFKLSEAPQGFRITSMEITAAGKSAKLVLQGRYSGFDSGTLWYDILIKRSGKVVAQDRDNLRLVSRQGFKDTVYLDVEGELTNLRAFLKFGEIYTN